MPRSIFVLFTVLCSASAVVGADHDHHAATKATTQGAAYQAELGKLHHPVSTQNADAQQAFDQGLTLVYAFNHDEAINSFKRALALDPKLAMAHWGIALALGPNYNLDVDPPREKQAFEQIQQALKLADGASEPERDYINALAARFSDAEKPDLTALAENIAAPCASWQRSIRMISMRRRCTPTA